MVRLVAAGLERRERGGGSVDVVDAPAAGREVAAADRPVPGAAHLLAEQPRCGLLEARVVGRDSGRTQGEHGERRIPDRRLAGLGADAVAVVDEEALPALDRASERLV